jgi:hypothetical protein
MLSKLEREREREMLPTVSLYAGYYRADHKDLDNTV